MDSKKFQEIDSRVRHLNEMSEDRLTRIGTAKVSNFDETKPAWDMILAILVSEFGSKSIEKFFTS